MNSKANAFIILFLLLSAICLSPLCTSGKADYGGMVGGYETQAIGSFIDSNGKHHVLGQIFNTGPSYMSSITITFILYGDNHTILDNQTTTTFLPCLPPYTVTPFDLVCSSPTITPQIKGYYYQISNVYDGSIQEGLQILSENFSVDQSGNLHLTGQIENIGNLTSNNTKVYVLYYNENGTGVDAGFASTSISNISAGSVSPFDIICSDQSQIPLIAGYFLTAQSDQYALKDDGWSPTLLNMSSMINSSNSGNTFDTLLQPSNNDEFPWLLASFKLSLVAIMIASVIVLKNRKII